MTQWDVNETGSGENTRLQRWVDPAMYVAEPVPEGGPRVYLLEATPDPLGSIAAAAALYEGGVRRSKAEVTHEERQKYLRELQKTKIKAPLEFVQFHFLFEGVTRGFTHQLVRQRTATFVQESTRFAVKEDMPVGLPPSLAGTQGTWKKHHERIIEELEHGQDCEDCLSHVDELMGDAMFHESEVERRRWWWDLVREHIASGYQYLVNSGMPAEDARGLLPTNLLTRVHYSTDLRALLDHAGNRLCTQAQFEWRVVFAKMAERIRGHDTGTTDYNGELQRDRDRWQWEAIAALLQPVCYQIGKCAFDSDMDRKCSIRNRVQANHELGRESVLWGQEHDAVEDNPIVSGVGPQSVVRTEAGNPVFIGAIHPREWLADPGAAR